MTRLTLAFLLGTLLLAVPVLGADAPAVLQPNTSAYSAAELSLLLPAVARLETVVSGSALASRRSFAPDDWQSRDFARYTAGTLAETGYAVRLASGAGWPDGVHTWVLVGIPLAGKTAWVPVEASPAAGHSQQNLGYVPKSGAGSLRFPESYTLPSAVVELPANLPPVAAIRGPTLGRAQQGESVTFFAVGSQDPDGEIVLYQWDFGDGETGVSNASVAHHAFATAGTYAVSLSVIDSGGKRATAALRSSFEVTAPGTKDEAGTPEGGCGCGK